MKLLRLPLLFILVSGVGLSVSGQANFVEDFDSGTPAGWTDSYSNISTQACSGSSERDNIYSGSSTGDMTSPTATSNGTDVTFAFDYKIVDWSAATAATAAGWGTIELQYNVNSGGWTTFHTINDGNHVTANTCANVSETIAAANVPNGATVQFRIYNTWAAGDYYMYLDNVSITQVIACPTPSSMAAGSVTATSANLTWTAGASETTWDLEWKAGADFTPDNSEEDGSASPTTTPAHSLSSLTANTTYYVYYRADCGGSGTSTWVGPFTFTTACGAVTTFPSTADMSTHVPNACWSEAGSGEVADGPTGTTSDWRGSRSYQNSGGSTVNSNAINLYQNVDREWLLSEQYDLSSGGPYQLRVEVAVTDWASSGGPTTTPDNMGSDDEVKLLMSTDGGASWSTLTTWNAGNQPSVNGTEYTEDLTAQSGTVQFAVWGSDGTTDDSEDYDFHIGVFVVEDIPACPTPSTMAAGSVAATTANLTWMENGSATTWNLEWKAGADFTPGTGAEDGSTSPTTTPAYSMSSLTAQTTYYVYYQADCGGSGTSNWVGPYTFTTPCAAATDFSENFDATATEEVPGCWTELIDNGASSFAYADVRASNSNSGANSLTMYNSGSSSTSNIIIVSPVLSNLNAGTHRLRFYAKNNSATQDIEVGTITDPADGSTFTSLQSVDINTTYAEYTVDFSSYPGSDTYVAIRRLSTSTYTYVYLDDVVWEAIPTLPNCSVLSSPADASTDIAVATNLSWASNIDATGYKLSIGTTMGGTDILNASDLGNVTSYDPPADLAFGQTYYVTLIAYNANGDATSCTETSFTTIDGCVTASTPADASTDIGIVSSASWSAVTGATGYKVSIGTSAGGTDVVNAADNGNATTYDMSGASLAYSTTYHITIVAYNANGDATGCSSTSFTTEADPTQMAPYSETFNASIPGIWGQSATAGGPWVMGGTFAWNTTGCNVTPSDHTGNAGNYVALDFSTTGGTDAGVILEMPPVNISALTTPYLEFYHFMCGTGYSPLNELHVEAWNGSSWSNVASIINGTAAWQEFSYNLTTHVYSTNLVKIRFRAEGGGSSDVYYGDQALDDISIQEAPVTPPNCDAAMTSPTDAATGVGIGAAISWSAATGSATGYKIQIGTTMGGSEFLTQTDAGNVLTYDPANDFAFNTTYYVNITPYNGNGDANSGCTEYSFTTTDGCVTATTPADAATDISLTSSISWSALGVAGYKVSIGTTAGGTDIVNAHDNGTATTYDMSSASLANSTTYYITIVGYNDVGDATGCSSTSFTTVAPPPANDECAGAFVIDLANSTVSGNSNNATESQTGCNGTEDDDVWFTFTALADGDATITVSPTGTDPINDIIFEFASGSCGSLTNITCRDGSGTSSDEVLTQAVTNGTTYFIRVYSYYGAGDEGEFTVNVSTNVLPVEMTSFTAKAEGTVNRLEWSTASEENNARFDVERSTNGVDFETIGQVEGNGTTVEVSNYNFVDEASATVSYYRLRQVDFDGNYEHSNIVVVKREAGNNNVTMFPIPVQDRLTVQYTATANEDMTITVTDATGRIVVSKAVTAIQGENQFNLNLNELPSGSYFVRLQSDNSNIIRTIIKQ